MNSPPDPGGGPGPPWPYSKPPSPAAYVQIEPQNFEVGYATCDSNSDMSLVAASFRKRSNETKKTMKNKKNRNSKKHHRSSSNYSEDTSDVSQESQIPLGQDSSFRMEESFAINDNNASSSQIPLGQATPDSFPTLTPSMQIPSSFPVTNVTQSQSQENPVVQSHRAQYSKDDIGPFVVHVERLELDPQSGTTIHPVNFGKLLFRNKVLDIAVGSIKKIGRNRISILFNSYNGANRFMDNEFLSTNSYKAFIPSFAICKMGFITGVPTDWTDDEILELFEVPQGFGKIIKVRRLNRRKDDGWHKTQSIVLTFDGQALPKNVYAVYNSFEVLSYRYPTIQCFQCCRFGHTKSKCRSQPRCYKCGQNHQGDTCATTTELSKCLHCSGNHFANDKNCPELERQKAIKQDMTSKTISYAEASKLHAPVKKSFAEITKSYKKTIFKKPKPPTPLGQGYDRKAHNDIIATSPYHSGNGIALSRSEDSHQATDSINEILSANLSLPHLESLHNDHVAPLINVLINALMSYVRTTKNNAMELPKC